MAINLPNQFACATRTAVMESPTVDLRGFAQPGIPDELARQLVCGRFLLSMAGVMSTVSGEDEIRFTETLLKVPVEIAGRQFLFPVATWVTHEYSLIRGYLLGFNKFFVSGGADIDTASLETQDLQFDMRGRLERSPMVDDELPEEQGLPLLLWTDYSVAAARSKGFAVPDFVDYQRASMQRMPGSAPVGRLFDRPLVPVAAYEIRDTFTMTGTTALPVDSIDATTTAVP